MTYTYKIKVYLYNVFWRSMIVRLYYKENLNGVGQFVEFDEKQSRYLGNVLRLRAGDEIYLFDGKNGEYKAELTEINKKSVRAVLRKKSREMQASPDIWLLFAPLKKDKTDMVLQKAVELGVSRIMPVQTAFTNAEKVRLERYEAQTIEAAEQCRRLDLPEISNVQALDKILENWNAERTLFFLDERGAGGKITEAMPGCKKAAIIIGPEGGFSESEAQKLRSLSFVKSVSLGRRILRAETAAIAALACWQSINGDW